MTPVAPPLVVPAAPTPALWLVPTVLLGLLGLVVLVAVWLRQRHGGASAYGPVRVLARVPLEPKRSLIVVELAHKQLLLASSEAGLTLLCELPEGAVVVDDSHGRRDFASLLRLAFSAHGRPSGTAGSSLVPREREGHSRPEVDA